MQTTETVEQKAWSKNPKSARLRVAPMVRSMVIWIFTAGYVSAANKGQQPRRRRRRRRHHRRQQRITNNSQDSYEDGSTEVVTTRISIEPFEIILSPTAEQLTYQDEENIITILEDVVSTYVIGILNETDGKMSLDYALFRGIESNALIEHNDNVVEQQQQFNDEFPNHSFPATILLTRGGIMKLILSDSSVETPTELDVTRWIQTAIDTEFVVALQSTPYDSIEAVTYQSLTSPPTQAPTINTIVIGGLGEGDGIVVGDKASTEPNVGTIVGSILGAIVLLSILLATLATRKRKSSRVFSEVQDDDDDKTELSSTTVNPVDMAKTRKNKSINDRSQLVIIEDLSNVDDRTVKVSNAYGGGYADQQSVTSEWTMSTATNDSVMLKSYSNTPHSGSSSATKPLPMFQNELFELSRPGPLQKDMIHTSPAWSNSPSSRPSTFIGNNEDTVLQKSSFSAAQEKFLLFCHRRQQEEQRMKDRSQYRASVELDRSWDDEDLIEDTYLVSPGQVTHERSFRSSNTKRSYRPLN